VTAGYHSLYIHFGSSQLSKNDEDNKDKNKHSYNSYTILGGSDIQFPIKKKKNPLKDGVRHTHLF